MIGLAGASATAALVLAASVAAPGADRLAVLHRGEWRTWWQADRSRAEWRERDAALARLASWQVVQPGLETAELRIAARAPALRIRLILLRIDSRQFDWSLIEQRDANGRPAWQVDEAGDGVAFAFNAGQFGNDGPWGWLVRAGEERQPPRSGPLSMALAIDRARDAHLIAYNDIPDARRRGDIVLALQSYPMLLAGAGVVPEALRGEGRGVDLRHRDSRLALGQLRDGRLILALTRYDVGGGLLRPLPIGPNTPEMAAIMGALGCAKAVMLDGGISSQLIVRARDGTEQRWDAYRRVPLGLLATPTITLKHEE